MNTAIYQDTDLPTFKKRMAVYSIAECAKHFSNNYEFLKNQLESKLGLTQQWKKDMAKAGTLHEVGYNANHEPQPYEISRIRSMVTGYQVLTISRGALNIEVQENSFNDAFVVDFQQYIDGRMQSTQDKMIADKKSFDESEESERKAQREIELIKAKKLLERDASMPDFQRNAMHKDGRYSASIKAASNLINSAAVSKKTAVTVKKKRVAPAKATESDKAYAMTRLASAEKVLGSRKKILDIRKRSGKADKISEAESDFNNALEAVTAAKSTLSTFQC